MELVNDSYVISQQSGVGNTCESKNDAYVN